MNSKPKKAEKKPPYKALKENYSTRYLQSVAEALSEACSGFDTGLFLATVFDDAWADRELKARMYHITRAIHQTLQKQYPEKNYAAQLAILRQACTGFNGYEGMFFPAYIELYGLEQKQVSIPALAEFTVFSSSEFAIRPFIERYPEQMFRQLERWSKYSNLHIRRLASEGCRPMLPWAGTLPMLRKQPDAIFPVLENLMTDESLYVRKSVANNLNDISKDHPEKVLRFCEEWQNRHPHADWIIKRALRTLLKAGNAHALALFGYGDTGFYTMSKLVFDQDEVTLGSTLSFSFSVMLKAHNALATRIEYRLHYPGKNSERKKLFHVFDKHLQPGKKHFSVTHDFRNLSTRHYHPGLHRIEILINGQPFREKSLNLITDRHYQ